MILSLKIIVGKLKIIGLYTGIRNILPCKCPVIIRTSGAKSTTSFCQNVIFVCISKVTNERNKIYIEL